MPNKIIGNRNLNGTLVKKSIFQYICLIITFLLSCRPLMAANVPAAWRRRGFKSIPTKKFLTKIVPIFQQRNCSACAKPPVRRSPICMLLFLIIIFLILFSTFRKFLAMIFYKIELKHLIALKMYLTRKIYPLLFLR